MGLPGSESVAGASEHHLVIDLARLEFAGYVSQVALHLETAGDRSLEYVFRFRLVIARGVIERVDRSGEVAHADLVEHSENRCQFSLKS